MTEVARCLPTALGFYGASGTGAGGVCIYPNGTEAKFVWRVQWPADIVLDLVTWDNLAGGITYSGSELAALVLQESWLPLV